MKNKFLLILSVLVLVAAFVSGSFLLVTSSKNLIFNDTPLLALRGTKRSGLVSGKKGKNLGAFKFSDIQHKVLKENSSTWKGLSLGLTIIPDEKEKKQSDTLTYGFLDKENNFSENRGCKVFVPYGTCNVKSFTVFLTIDDVENLSGFYVRADSKVKIDRVSVSAKKMGFEKNNGSPVFYFGPSGGQCDFTFSKFDFTDASSFITYGEKAGDKVNPVMNIDFIPCDDIGTFDAQRQVHFKYGNEEIYVRRSKGRQRVVIQTECFLQEAALLQFGIHDAKRASLVHNEDVEKIIVEPNDPLFASSDAENGKLRALPVDLGMIIDTPKEHWRNEDFEVYSWSLFPKVIFLDIKDYKVQESFLARIAFFVEKQGYKGTLVDDDFISRTHSYNAHDYKAYDLAAFYNLAKKTNYPLTKNEISLAKILVNEGVLKLNSDGFFEEGEGCVISISMESQDYLRRTFVAHESWHGIYFLDEDFRNFVEKEYNAFDSASMQFIKTFWHTQKGLNYDLNDDYLMKNEFMAYIMQQSLRYCSSYFVQISNRESVIENQSQDAAYIRSNNAFYFVKACQSLNDYAFTRWALAAGRVHLVSR